MTTKNTESYMQKFERLEAIKTHLSTQKPNLDELMPYYDETASIEQTLSEFFKNTKQVIAEKRQQREMENK
jgi:exonuclease VII small subunit